MNRSNNDDDVLTWLLVGAVVLGAGGGVAFWSHVTAWLVEHHVLVAGSAHPAVSLPGTEAGLDVPRIAIAIAAVIMLAGLGVFGVRHREVQR